MSDDSTNEEPKPSKGAFGWYKPPKHDMFKSALGPDQKELDPKDRELKRIGDAFFDHITSDIKADFKISHDMIEDTFDGADFSLWVYAHPLEDKPEYNIEDFKDINIRIDAVKGVPLYLQTEYGTLPSSFIGKNNKYYSVRNEYEINRETGKARKMLGFVRVPHQYVSMESSQEVMSIPDFEIADGSYKRESYIDINPEDMEQLQGWLELIRLGGLKKYIPKPAA